MNKTMNTRNCTVRKNSVITTFSSHQIFLNLSFEELQHLTEKTGQARRESVSEAGRELGNVKAQMKTVLTTDRSIRTHCSLSKV